MKISNRIIPHNQFPLTLTVPHVKKNSDIILKFSLNSLNQSVSPTLKYGNYIAVKFSKYPQADFDISTLNENDATKHRCHLSDLSGKSFKLIAVPTILSPFEAAEDLPENDIVYCQFLDQNREVPTNTNLTLIISLNYKIQQAIYHNLTLMIVTSNHRDKIILEALPSFGNFMLYYEFDQLSNEELSSLKISNLSILPSQRACESPCIIYPYDSVKLEINFEVTNFIDMKSLNMMVIQFDSDLFDINEESLELALKAVDDANKELVKGEKEITISILNDFSNNSKKNYSYLNMFNMYTGNTDTYVNKKMQLTLNYIGEDFIKNRKFRIDLGGIKVTDKMINIESFIECIVYNVNTYKIVSYHKPALPILIKPINVGNFVDPPFSGISHPDYINIYQSGAWPIDFRFYPSQQSIKKSVWVVIQQSNTSKSSRFNFIASTCDFSNTIAGNTVINNEFSKRPICYPLRNDFNYINISSTSDYLGSGVFFKLNDFLTTVKYSVTIWGYADVCGENQLQTVGNVVKYPSPLGIEFNKSIATFKFNYSVYKNINSNNSNANNNKNLETIQKLIQSAHFNKDSNSNIENIASEKLKNYSVYSNLTEGEGRFVNLTKIAEGNNIEMFGRCYGTVLSGTEEVDSFADLYSKVTLTSINKKGDDILLYKEITDIHLGKKANETPCVGCYMQNVNSSASSEGMAIGFEEYFIFSTESLQQSLNFFVLKSDHKFPRYTKIANYIPLPLYYEKTTGTYERQIGYLDIHFGSTFLADSKVANCYFSWALKNKKADISQNNLFYEPGEKYQDNIIVKEPSVDNSTIEIISNVTSGFRDILFTAGNRNRIKSKLNQNTGPNQGKGDYKFFIDAFTEEKKETQSGGGAAARNLAEVEYDTFNLNFFTTCFKLVPIPSEIRSIFSHLDFHVAWKTISDNKAEGEVNRVMRFIKLYPEINVFSCGDLCTTNSKITNINDAYSFHFGYSYTNYSTTNTGICIVEINSQSLNLEGSSIFIFLHGLLLIDTDFNEVVSTYPAGPLVTASAYAYNSAYSKSNLNQLHKNYIIDAMTGKTTTIFNTRYDNLRQTTAYYFYLSSYIMIYGYAPSKITSTSAVQNSLLIPVICPSEHNEDNGYPEQDIRITMLFVNVGNTYDSITAVNKIVSNTLSVTNSGIINFSFKKTDTFKGNGLKQATLRFKTYTDFSKDSDTPLYLLNGNAKNLGDSLSISSMALYYNSIVQEEASGDIIMKYYLGDVLTDKYFIKTTNFLGASASSTFRFYINGVMYNKMQLMVITNDEAEIEIDSSTATGNGLNTATPYSLDHNLTKVTFSGIKRPAIENFGSNLNLESIFETNSNTFNTVLGDNNVSIMNSPTALINTLNLNFNLNIGISNLIGISCSNKNPNSNIILTNLVVRESGTLVKTLDYKIFIVDNIWDIKGITGIVLSKERDGDFFKADNSGSIKIDLPIPGFLPQLSTINISSDSFTANTMCGYISTNQIAISCTKGTENITKKCRILNGVLKNSKISICCYNVNTANDPLILKKLSIDYYKYKGTENNIIIEELPFDGVITTPTVNPDNANLYTLTTKQTTAILVSESKAIIATLSYTFYTQTTHIEGVGVMWFRVELPRPPYPGLKLTFEGDFRPFNLSGILPECFFTYSDLLNDPEYQMKDQNYFFNFNNSKHFNDKTSKFGTEYDKGDFLIDGCKVVNFNSSLGKIILFHKKLIHKCTISPINRIIYIQLNPVKVVDLNNEKIKALKYSILGEITTTLDMVISKSVTFGLSSTQVLDKNTVIEDGKAATFISDTLCPGVINLGIASGVEVEFSFLFDTNTTSKTLSSYAVLEIQPNEVSIWWDLTKFKISHNTHCRYKGKVSYCNVDYNTGIMNIYLNEQILDLKNIKDPISVVNVILTANDVTDLVFPCTINNVKTDDKTGIKKRLNLLIGSGRLKDKIKMVFVSPTLDNNGDLIIYAVKNQVINLVPRETSEMKFKIIPSSRKTISGTPVFIFSLPKQFSNHLYDRKNVSVYFREFEYDADNALTQEKKNDTNPTIQVKSTEVVGNTIIVIVNASSISMGSKFAFYEVTITSMLNPGNNMNIINDQISLIYDEAINLIESKIPFPYSDGINVILTNLDNSSIFRTFSNTNSFYSEEIIVEESKFLHNIYYYKGYNYSFTKDTKGKKIEVDFYSKLVSNNPNPKNIIVVKAGRFSKIQVLLSEDDNNTKLTSCLIKLNKESAFNSNGLFETENQNYLIANHGINEIEINIGTTCSTFPSVYFIKFDFEVSLATEESTSEVNNNFDVADYFYPMDIVKVLVSNTPGIITMYKNPNFKDSNKIANEGVLDGVKEGGIMIFYLLDDMIFQDSIINWKNISETKSTDVNFYPGMIYKYGITGYSSLSNTATNAVEYQTFELDLSEGPGGGLIIGTGIPVTSNLNTLLTGGAIKRIGCFKSDITKVKVTLTSAIDKIKIDNIRDSFAFLNASDENNKTLKQNEIEFWYTPRYLKSYLWCSLVCFNDDFPKESVIVQHTQIKDTEKVKFRQLYVDIKDTYSFKFSNLLRGEQYKLKCILQSPDSNQTKAENRTVVFDVFSNTSNVNLPITTPITSLTSCVTYQFEDKPEEDIKNNILNMFQLEFAKDGFMSGGCVVAVDTLNKTINGFINREFDTCKQQFKESFYLNDKSGDIFIDEETNVDVMVMTKTVNLIRNLVETKINNDVLDNSKSSFNLNKRNLNIQNSDIDLSSTNITYYSNYYENEFEDLENVINQIKYKIVKADKASLQDLKVVFYTKINSILDLQANSLKYFSTDISNLNSLKKTINEKINFLLNRLNQNFENIIMSKSYTKDLIINTDRKRFTKEDSNEKLIEADLDQDSFPSSLNHYFKLISLNKKDLLKKIKTRSQISNPYRLQFNSKLNNTNFDERNFDFVNNNHITEYLSDQLRLLQTAEEIKKFEEKTYTVCGIQLLNCASKFAKNYQDHIAEITNKSNKPADFKLNFAPGVGDPKFSKHTIKRDSDKPNVEQLTIKSEFNSTYFLNIHLTSVNPYICYYRLQAKLLKTIPTISEMLCKYNSTQKLSYCGIMRSNAQGYPNNIYLREDLLQVKNYRVYVVCFNDYIGSKNPSDIKEIASFGFSSTGTVCEDQCVVEDKSENENSQSEVAKFCDPDNKTAFPCDGYSASLKIFIWLVFLILIN